MGHNYCDPTPVELAHGITPEYRRRQAAHGWVMAAVISQREFATHQEHYAYAEKVDAEIEKMPDWFLLALGDAVTPQDAKA